MTSGSTAPSTQKWWTGDSTCPLNKCGVLELRAHFVEKKRQPLIPTYVSPVAPLMFSLLHVTQSSLTSLPNPFPPLTLLSFSPQLKYRETLQEGAALRVPFVDTEGGSVELQISPIVEAAVKVLRPNQGNQNVEPFYRQQAWHAIQVGVVCAGVGVRHVQYLHSDWNGTGIFRSVFTRTTHVRKVTFELRSSVGELGKHLYLSNIRT